MPPTLPELLDAMCQHVSTALHLSPPSSSTPTRAASTARPLTACRPAPRGVQARQVDAGDDRAEHQVDLDSFLVSFVIK
ncbi:hypothetical protein ATCC90586_010251 [Pythium insidiosum]|nr:hypothetical protein ATCC90586_010251 [Pythium insidiosum]